MTQILHLILKYPNLPLNLEGRKSDTTTEHKTIFDTYNRLIWGQGSNKKINAVSEKNRNRIKKQISKNVNTYAFLVANNKGMREVYVGKLTNIYGRKEISYKSSLTTYMPDYFASEVGTDDDINNLFIDVSTFFKIDEKYLDCIIVESNGKKVLSVKNASSVFLVNIDEQLDGLLEEMVLRDIK